MRGGFISKRRAFFGSVMIHVAKGGSLKSGPNSMKILRQLAWELSDSQHHIRNLLRSAFSRECAQVWPPITRKMVPVMYEESALEARNT